MLDRIKTARVEGDGFPDREGHTRMFAGMLADAYAQALRQGEPMLFLYVGQTSTTRPPRGLASAMAVAQPSELIVAFLIQLELARADGVIPDALLRAFIADCERLLPEGER